MKTSCVLLGWSFETAGPGSGDRVKIVSSSGDELLLVRSDWEWITRTMEVQPYVRVGGSVAAAASRDADRDDPADLGSDQAVTIPTHQQIHAALLSRGLEVETWNTGGGCMVTAAIIERDEQGAADRYVGVTHEDEWVICHYRGEDESLLWTKNLKPGDLAGMADWVASYVGVMKEER